MQADLEGVTCIYQVHEQEGKRMGRARARVLRRAGACASLKRTPFPLSLSLSLHTQVLGVAKDASQVRVQL